LCRSKIEGCCGKDIFECSIKLYLVGRFPFDLFLFVSFQELMN